MAGVCQYGLQRKHVIFMPPFYVNVKFEGTLFTKNVLLIVFI